MSKKVISEELVNANKKLASQNEEKAERAAELVIANEEKSNRADELITAKTEKAEREAELVIANEEKKERADELVIAKTEKAEREAELVIANEEKSDRADELIIANIEKAKRADELVIAKAEKAEREAELVIAKEEKERLIAELIIADKEKAERSAELVVANAEKAGRSAELVIANAEKAKSRAVLIIANLEKEKRANELVVANNELNYQRREKAKRNAELVIANTEKTIRKAALVIANVEKARLAAELIVASKELLYQKEEKAKRSAELVIANAEKAKRAATLVIANIKKAKRAAELVIANVEKSKRAAELVVADKELLYQKEEKAKRSAELIIADVEKAQRSAELVIANIEKAKRAAEFVIANKELMLAKEKEKLAKELVIANRELIKAKDKAEESDRLKTAFLTNMSHEIRTPMNGILGFAELLKEPGLSSDNLKNYVQIIQISGARMLNTINNIVNISKIESGLVQVDINETNINEKIEFTYNFFKPEAEFKKVQLSFKNSLQSKEAIIKTDNEKVYGILTNLVKNAIKFTYEGSIELGYEKKGEYLEFFVKDTGIGVQQKQKELIFESFRQGSESHSRGYDGSGLGLSIAKSYVEMLGGKIWVESEEGKGSKFYFTIPYNAVSEEKTVIANIISEKDKEVQLKKLKILIVEDDEISYSLLTRMLQNINCEVLHAITGVEAVETCRTNPDLDLILMDIRMPKMDGNEATRQIRQFNKDVIIIAQTAYAFSGDKEKAIETGCNNYITKPINMNLLNELIQKHCYK
ncbi:MAG: response regulator [Bacteroidales bacterium]|nr:response regulator [Bacteroidales bacterium]